jgi:hypothetical protein
MVAFSNWLTRKRNGTGKRCHSIVLGKNWYCYERAPTPPAILGFHFLYSFVNTEEIQHW